MKRTARTVLLSAVLIMSMSILPAKHVWADAGEVTGAVREVQIGGSGYIGAAPETASDGGEALDNDQNPDDNEKSEDESDAVDGNPVTGNGQDSSSSGERKAAGIAAPVTGDQLQLLLYLTALIGSIVLISILTAKHYRIHKTR